MPRAVHRLAENLIQTVTRRQAKGVSAARRGRRVDRTERDTYKHVEYAILKDAEEHLAAGKTVMFLASCSYMLSPADPGAAEERHPVPQSVPQEQRLLEPDPAVRQARHDRQPHPVPAGRRIRRSASEHRPWTNGDLAQWAEVLQAKGILRHGVKSKLKNADLGKPATMERLDEIFEPAALDSLMAAWEGDYRGLLDWWRARVTSDVAERVKYPADIAARRGPSRVAGDAARWSSARSTPSKAAQADVVYLFPDLSQAGGRAVRARRRGSRDSVVRLFYVGATRAYEQLHVCQRDALGISL